VRKVGRIILELVDEYKSQHNPNALAKRSEDLVIPSDLFAYEGCIIPHRRLGTIAASTTKSLGDILKDEGNLQDAIEHFKRAKALIDEDDIFVKHIELSLIEAECERSGEKGGEEYLTRMRQIHSQSRDSFWSGVNLARALKKEHQGIEAQRLIVDLIARSRRVHGPDHPDTLWAEGVGEDITLRKFTIGNYAQMYDYQITGYSNDSQDEYTLFGPIDERVMEHQSSGRLMQPTNMEWVTKTTARIEDGMLDSGTPVIVRGLTGPNAHLNGEIGYTLSIRLGDYLWKKACVSHYGVHFENAELGECKISAGNLRVLFDLPDERSRPDCG